MPLAPDIAEFYTRPGRMTDAGALNALLEDAPRDIPGIVAFIQNLLLHVHWAARYGVTLSTERRDEQNVRSTADMLALMQRHDGRPLRDARAVDQRAVGTCRNFSVFGTALFRRAGIPSRSRVGFGSYFNKGTFEDHWVIEYWNGTAWQLLDAQIDEKQRSVLQLTFDTRDVPRSEFVIAGDAWQKCRSGKADPKTFGIFDLRGLWFIAGNVVRDFASLNNEEMLPWDVWGGMPQPEETLGDEALAFFDRLAALTRDPDAAFAKLHSLYDGDERLRVPATVFNAVRQRPEAV